MGLAKLITRVIDLFYIQPISKLFTLNTYRYAVCGGVNMVLDTVYYFLIYNFVICKEVVHIGCVAISPHIATMLIVFPVIFFNGFWLNKNVAFSYSPLKTNVQLVRYALSVLGAIGLNYICLKLFVDGIGIWATPAKMLTTVVSVVYSYLMARFFTFKAES